jgi:predicted alpha/beta hydrolase family esterase
MKKAYVLHGICDEEEYFSKDSPSPSNNHWLPWIQHELLKLGYLCQTPEARYSYKGNYEDWKIALDPLVIDNDTTLIGHSAGNGFFLKWLSLNHNIIIEKLVMVAPWLDLKNEYKDFLSFDFDAELEDRISEIHIFYSTDEQVEGVRESTDLLIKKLPKAKLHKFDKHGHFALMHMKTQEFPELLEVVVNDT